MDVAAEVASFLDDEACFLLAFRVDMVDQVA